jgi:hypothetical protein
MIAVIKDPEGALLRLDLKDPTARDALSDCHDKDDILKTFRDHGGAYI